MPSFLLKELYMRIDKYISGCGYASRKDVKKLIKQGLVFINGEVCKSRRNRLMKTVLLRLTAKD